MLAAEPLGTPSVSANGAEITEPISSTHARIEIGGIMRLERLAERRRRPHRRGDQSTDDRDHAVESGISRSRDAARGGGRRGSGLLHATEHQRRSDRVATKTLPQEPRRS